jgi:phosphatidate phosphatase LPIN
MNFVGKFVRGAQQFYSEINPATLTGAIDVIVVQQEDGSFRSSPFHVRFGKLGVIKSREKKVYIEINDEMVEELNMELGDAGEAYFTEKCSNNNNNNNNETSSHIEQQQEQRQQNNQNEYDDPDDDDEKISSSESLTINSIQTTTIKEQQQQKKESDFIAIETMTPVTCSLSIRGEAKEEDTTTTTTATIKNTRGPGYFLSDGEITPELTSPAVSRPTTPKSDIELIDSSSNKHHTRKQSITSEIANQWNWNWGQLPVRENTNTNKYSKTQTDDDSSILSNIFWKKKRTTTTSSSSNIDIENKNNDIITAAAAGGIYLDDTEKLDSKNQALYLNPKAQKKESDEQDSGTTESPLRDSYSILGDVQISLCGFQANLSSLSLNSNSISTSLPNLSSVSQLDSSSSSSVSFEDLFQAHAVPFEKFMDEITTISANGNLVLKINNRYMNWASASPIILSAILYQKNLPHDTLNMVLDTHMPKGTTTTTTTATTVTTTTTPPTTTTKSQTSNANEKKSSWGNMFWGSKSAATTKAPVAASESSSSMKKTPTTTTTTKQLNPKDQYDYHGIFLSGDEDEEVASLNSTFEMESNNYYQRSSLTTTTTTKSNHHHHHRNKFARQSSSYRKTTRLSSSLIEKLNLKPGPNEIKYSVTTALQGTTRISSYIFLWSYDDKIIVSDVDGTITKSDVWGQVLPIFGRDWSQAGVADLFTAIQRNDYKFIYLSARAIGQSKITRDLLRNINQDGFTLPEGPLLVTPTSLFTAFQKEVIERKPEEFKISCLKDIQSLFSSSDNSNNPYYAGYGNKSTDVTSYKAVGIPISRIFTINPQGEVKHEVSRTFQSSYSKLCDYVDLIFPPFQSGKTENLAFNYWRHDPSLDHLDLIDEMNELCKVKVKGGKDKKTKSLIVLVDNNVDNIRKNINDN